MLNTTEISFALSTMFFGSFGVSRNDLIAPTRVGLVVVFVIGIAIGVIRSKIACLSDQSYAKLFKMLFLITTPHQHVNVLVLTYSIGNF